MARHYLVLAMGVLCVSFAALLIRLADAPAIVIAAYRLGIASLVIVPLGWRRLRVRFRDLSLNSIIMMLVAGACLAVHFGLWITSLQYTSVATSVVLVTASPIFLAVASRFLFGQRLRLPAIAGIVIALIGAILIGYGNWTLGQQPLIGSMLALGGALAVSGYLLIGQKLRRSVDLLSYASVVYSSAAVLLVLAVPVLGYHFAGYSWQTYLMMALLALLPQVIGHSSLNWSLRFVPATFVAISVLGEPVGATLWAFLLLGEVPDITELIGGLLILIGIFMAMRNDSKSPNTAFGKSPPLAGDVRPPA